MIVRNTIKLIIGLLAVFVTLAPLRAQQRDSIRFSLLTCAPGSEIYELFGHTALRYQNLTRGTDVVFNYGMFSFKPKSIGNAKPAAIGRSVRSPIKDDMPPSEPFKALSTSAVPIPPTRMESRLYSLVNIL